MPNMWLWWAMQLLTSVVVGLPLALIRLCISLLVGLNFLGLLIAVLVIAVLVEFVAAVLQAFTLWLADTPVALGVLVLVAFAWARALLRPAQASTMRWVGAAAVPTGAWALITLSSIGPSPLELLLAAAAVGSLAAAVGAGRTPAQPVRPTAPGSIPSGFIRRSGAGPAAQRERWLHALPQVPPTARAMVTMVVGVAAIALATHWQSVAGVVAYGH